MKHEQIAYSEASNAAITRPMGTPCIPSHPMLLRRISLLSLVPIPSIDRLLIAPSLLSIAAAAVAVRGRGLLDDDLLGLLALRWMMGGMAWMRWMGGMAGNTGMAGMCWMGRMRLSDSHWVMVMRWMRMHRM